MLGDQHRTIAINLHHDSSKALVNGCMTDTALHFEPPRQCTWPTEQQTWKTWQPARHATQVRQFLVSHCLLATHFHVLHARSVCACSSAGHCFFLLSVRLQLWKPAWRPASHTQVSLCHSFAMLACIHTDVVVLTNPSQDARLTPCTAPSKQQQDTRQRNSTCSRCTSPCQTR